MGPTVLVVDDEKNICDVLRANLEREGYRVLVAEDGLSAVDITYSQKPDLILLDCMLPKMDGYDVCKKVRQQHTMPILMLTAKSEEIDKILGLELGADDYITKPFSMREVLARVKAHLRRFSYQEPAESIEEKTLIRFDDYSLDLKSFELKKSGEPVNLTLREFELLSFLAQHPGEVFSREQLLAKVWGYEYFGDVRTVDVTVRRTREKIEPDARISSFRYILTKRGVGYYFDRSTMIN